MIGAKWDGEVMITVILSGLRVKLLSGNLAG